MRNNTSDPAHGTSSTCQTCGQVHRRTLVRPSVAALICAVVTIVLLGALASGLPDYWRNFALNTAADLFGAAIFIHVIGPIAQRRRDEHGAEHDADTDADPPHIPAPRAELPQHEQNPTDTAIG